MGRNLELKQLTEEEEKKILEVIQRDYDLRKKEEKRIDKLKNEVETKPPPTQQQTTQSTDECNNCGSTLIWLINPKGQCTKCELYFCENKKECLSEDFYTSKLMCTNCQIETDLQASSAEWFYSQLKGKFRRFGSAKVHRALRKLRRGRNIESASECESENEYSTGTSKSSSPNKSPDKAFIKFMEQQREQEGNTPELTPIIESEKEHCELVMDEVPNANEILIKPTQTDELQSSLVPNGHASSEFNSSITDEHGAAATVNVDVKTTNVEVNNNPPQITPEELSQSVKKELELVISELLLPQLEQLRKHDEERNKEEKAERVEEATKIAEEVILRALEKSKHDESFNTSEAISRYLQDNSDLIISHVSNQMADEAPSVHSVNSSIHDAKPEMRDSTTMTDIDQDKVTSIKSESHTSISSSHSSFVQDAATKQHLIAQAETQTAIADILDTEASSHEFTTELTFTAVTPQSPEILKRSPRFRSSSESSSSSSSSSKPIKTEDNWVIPARDAKKISVDETATSTTLMSLAPATSAYDHHSTSDSSDTDSDEVKQKEDKMKSSSESSSSDFEENQELQKTKNKLDKELEIAISLSNQANKHIEEVPSRSHSSSESSSDDESKPAHSIEAVSSGSVLDTNLRSSSKCSLHEYVIPIAIDKSPNRSRSSSESLSSSKAEKRINESVEVITSDKVEEANSRSCSKSSLHDDVKIDKSPNQRRNGSKISPSSTEENKIAESVGVITSEKVEEAFSRYSSKSSIYDDVEFDKSPKRSRSSSESSSSSEEEKKVAESVEVNTSNKVEEAVSRSSFESSIHEDAPVTVKTKSRSSSENSSSSESSQDDGDKITENISLVEDKETQVTPGRSRSSSESSDHIADADKSEDSSHDDEDTLIVHRQFDVIKEVVVRTRSFSVGSASENEEKVAFSKSSSTSSVHKQVKNGLDSTPKHSRSSSESSEGDIEKIAANDDISSKTRPSPENSESDKNNTEIENFSNVFNDSEKVPTPTTISVEIYKEEIMKKDESESSDSSSSDDESKKILPNFIARKKSSSASSHSSSSDDESKKVTKEKESSSESSDSDTEIIPQLVERKTSHLEREVTTDSDPDRKSPAPTDENELIIKEFQVKKVFKTTANISIDETPSAITHTDSMSSESTNFTDGQIVETPKLERKLSQSSSSSSSSSSSDDSKRYTDELMDLKPVDESTLDETPLATFVQPEEVKSISPTPEESAVALRTINKVEIDMVADTIHKISELKKEEEDHDSSSDSSSSSSSSDSEDDKDKLDKIEEDIYIASAKTQQLQRQLKDYQREVQNIDLDKIRAGLRMSSVEKKVYFAQIDLSKINIEGLSIKERIELLRLAGLQVEQESLKRSSLQEMKSPEDKPRKRWSVPLNTPPKDPVNASNKTSIQPRLSFTIRPKSSSTPIQTTAKVQYRRSLDQNLLKGVSKPSGEITVQLPRNSVKVLPPQPVTRKREVEIKKLSSESSSSSSSSSSESEDEEVTNYMKATPVAEPIPVLEEVKKKSPVTAKLAPQIVETTTIPSPKPKIRKQNPLPLSEEDSLRIQQLVDDYDTGHSEEEIPSYKPDLYDGEDDLERELQAIKKFKEKRTSMLVEEANRKNQLVAQMSNSNILPEERDEDSNQSSVYNSDIDGKVVSKSTKQSKEQELNLATKMLNKKLSKSPGSSIHSSFDSDVESKQKRAVNNSNLVEQKANGSNYNNASVDSSSDEEWTMQI